MGANTATKTWQVILDDGEHRIAVEHKPFSTVRISIDDEVWEQSDVLETDSDHLLCYRGHRIGVHIREHSDLAYTYELSLDGFSMKTGQPFPYTTTPLEGALKTWLVNLSGKDYLVQLEHEPYVKHVIRINGNVVEESSFEKEGDCDHLIHFSGHRFALHIRKRGKYAYHYSLSVYGVTVETGERVGNIQPTPMMDCDKKVWLLPLDGNTHTLEMSHKGLSNRLNVWVEGELVLQSGFSFEEEEVQHALTVGGQPCILTIQPRDNRYIYDLAVNGVSLHTGKPVTRHPERGKVIGGMRRWQVKLGGERHVIQLKGNWRGVDILYNGQVIHHKSMWKDMDDNIHSFTRAGHRFEVVIRRKGFLHSYDLFVNGVSVDDGRPLLPLKLVGKEVRWLFELEGNTYTVSLRHRKWLGTRRITVNDRLIANAWCLVDTGSVHTFTIDHHPCTVRIHWIEDDAYTYELIVDSMRVEHGRMVTVAEAADRKSPSKKDNKVSWRVAVYLRLREAFGVWVAGVLLLYIGHYWLPHRWLEWSEAMPVEWYLLPPAFAAISRLFEGYKGYKWVVTLGGIILILFLLAMFLYWEFWT